MTPSDRTFSGGVRCPDCHSIHTWTELDIAIYSDPTVTARNFTPGDLWWGWLCPVTGKELRREPFAFPADMPDFTSSQPDPENAQVGLRGTDPRLRGYNANEKGQNPSLSILRGEA